MTPQNPASTYNPNIKPYYYNFGQVGPVLLSQLSMAPPPIPGSIPSEYGSDPLTSYWQYQQSIANRPAYFYARGLDQETSRRNLSIMSQRLIRSSGLKLNEKQTRAVETAAGYIATYLPAATQIAQRLLASEGVENSTITQIISGLQQGVDYLNGPRGSVMPAYYQMQKQIGYMPVSEQRDFLYGYMHTAGAVNAGLDYTGGYRFADVAQIQNYAYSRGLNQVALADTGIARDVAQRWLSDPRVGLDKDDNLSIYNTLDRLAEQKYSKRFTALRETGSFEDYVGRQIPNEGDPALKDYRTQEWNNIRTGFSVSDRIRHAVDTSMLAHVNGDPLITNIDTLQDANKAIQSKIEKLDPKANAPQIKKYKRLQKDIDSYIETLKETPNLGDVYNRYQSKYEDELTSAYLKDEVATTENEARLLARTKLKIDKLQSFGLKAEDLTKKVKDKDGKEIFAWQAKLNDKKVSAEVKNTIRDLFETEEADELLGLNVSYDKYSSTISEAISKGKASILEKYKSGIQRLRKAQAEGKTAEVAAIKKEAWYKEAEEALKQENLGGQVANNQKALNQAVSNISSALLHTGSRLTSPAQAEQFLDMVTQGGLTYMSDERLLEYSSQLSASMISSGITDNQVMQASMQASQAAKRVGGDTRTAGANAAVAAGWAMSIARDSSGKMDVDKAIALTSDAMGMSGRSLTTRVISAIGAALADDSVKISGPYADILQKIKNGEDLTDRERDTLMAHQSEIMSAAGISKNDQHMALNTTHTGSIENYATLQGAKEGLYSKQARLVTKASMQDSLKKAGWGKLSEKDSDALFSIFRGTISTKNLDLLQDPTRAQEYKDKLIEEARASGNMELARRLEGMSAAQVQTVGNRMLQSTANAFNNGDVEQMAIRMETAGKLGMTAAQSQRLGAAAALAPFLPKDKAGAIMSVLTSPDSDIVNLIQAIKGNLNENLTAEQKNALADTIGVSSIAVDKHQGLTGIDKDRTAAANKTLTAMYKAMGNSPMGMKIANKVAAGHEKDLTEQEKKLYDARIAEAKKAGLITDDQIEKLQETVKESRQTVLNELNRSKPVDSVDRDPNAKPDENEAVNGANKQAPPKDKREPVSPKGGGSTSDPNKKADSDKNKKEGEKVSDEAGKEPASGDMKTVLNEIQRLLKGVISGKDNMNVKVSNWNANA